MVKNSPFNRMPKKGKPLPGNNADGKDSDDESNSSVDSHGNLRDLIDYGSDSEEPSPRPIRKAALLARKKIDLIMKKSRKADKAEKEEKATHMQNTIHYPTVRRRPCLPLSPAIYSPSSTEEDMEETEETDEETEEDEIDIEETDEEFEETESNEDNEELFRYLLKMGDRKGDTMVPKKYNMKLEPE